MLLFLLIILFLIYFLFTTKETFENNDYFIDYHVIHILGNIDRLKNIEIMEKKLGRKINLFQAIKGSDIDIEKIKKYDNNLKYNFIYSYKNEVGCYLSHLLLIKSLINTKYKYSIIFEDDFKITKDNYHWDIVEILNNVNKPCTEENDKRCDFDILFLGNLNNNHGDKHHHNIYKINDKQYLWGTHAYIINNSSIDKIYNNLLILDLAIDNKFKNLIDNKNLNGLVIYPIVIDVINDISTIRNI